MTQTEAALGLLFQILPTWFFAWIAFAAALIVVSQVVPRASVRAALAWIAQTEVFRWLVQSMIALDCFCNSFILPMLTFSVGMSGESMSAHTYRDAVKGRWWAVRIMPLIDWMFSWQAPDPRFVDEQGQVVTAHCHRAFLKLQSGYYLPPEYHTDAQRTAP